MSDPVIIANLEKIMQMNIMESYKEKWKEEIRTMMAIKDMEK
jgi:hypothetical protein